MAKKSGTRKTFPKYNITVSEMNNNKMALSLYIEMLFIVFIINAGELI